MAGSPLQPILLMQSPVVNDRVLAGHPGEKYDLTGYALGLKYGEVRVYHLPSKRKVFHFQGSEGKKYDLAQARNKGERALWEVFNRLKVGSDHWLDLVQGRLELGNAGLKNDVRLACFQQVIE